MINNVSQNVRNINLQSSIRRAYHKTEAVQAMESTRCYW